VLCRCGTRSCRSLSLFRGGPQRVAAGRGRAVATVNLELVATYWAVGRDILARQSEQGWGARVVDRLSADLQQRFPAARGFSPRNLKYMRALAEAWPDEAAIVQQPVAQLPWLVADALRTTTTCGATGTVVLRADSAYYGRDVIAAARRQHARFSITARKDRAVTAAIATIPDDGWTRSATHGRCSTSSWNAASATPKSPRSANTTFASKPKARQVTARLIVRRVRDQNPNHQVPDAQGGLFPAWRHHAAFTDRDLPMLTAEADHRRHAIIEQVIEDLKNGPLAHLPSGNFMANSAWLVLDAMAFNLTRAVGALASVFHAKAATATIRTQLIAVTARVTRSARRTTLRLPQNWPWAAASGQLFRAALAPPTAA
jgi:hypothetical protein